MENAWKERGERMSALYAKALEAGTLTSIALFHMAKRVMPLPMKTGREGSDAELSTDRRHDRRLKMDRTITCMCDGKEFNDLHLIDISRGGMYVEMAAPWEISEEAFFNLSGRNLGPIMRVKGHVMRRAEGGVAIQFC